MEIVKLLAAKITDIAQLAVCCRGRLKAKRDK